jgi:hypothetical protein
MPSPFTKGPAVLADYQRTENKGLNDADFERKYSRASTASFNNAMGIEDGENEENNADPLGANSVPGIYRPQAGSTLSSLMPTVNARKSNGPNNLYTRQRAAFMKNETVRRKANIKRNAENKAQFEFEKARLNALMQQRRPVPANYVPRSAYNRKPGTKKAYVFPPLMAQANNRKTRRQKKRRSTRRH